MSFSATDNIYQRLWMSILVTIVVLAAIYSSAFPYFRLLFLAGVSGVVGIAVWEFYLMAQYKKFKPLTSVGIVSAITYIIATFLSSQEPALSFFPQMVLIFTILATFLYYFFQGDNPICNIAVTLFGTVYVVVPLAYLIAIAYYFYPSNAQDGRLWLLYLLVVAKFSDIGGYIGGKNYGRKKLAPYISPGKTRAGAITGIIAALASSLIFWSIVTYVDIGMAISLTLAQSIFLGIAIAICGQLGDLAESLLKRDCSIKDSNQLPGLGGALDISDSLTFTAPLIYFFLKCST